MTQGDLYICSAFRTGIGKFNGSLSTVPAVKLGGIVISKALKSLGLDFSCVDECFMGCVLTGALGQAPARQAWLAAGGSEQVPCTTVGKVCGSGLQSVIFAGRGLMLNEFKIAVAGGMENMSAASCVFSAKDKETGVDISNANMVTMMVKDGLWDVYNDKHMGLICDDLARAEGITRQEQDDFAVRSYSCSIEATKKGYFSKEIVPVLLEDGSEYSVDEGICSFNPDKMRTIKGAFDKEKGTITAANASSINDGAAALVLANQWAINNYKLKPLAKIVSWGSGALSPSRFPAAPVIAVKNALGAAGLSVEDVDYWEINEAFAAVVLLAMRDLNISLDKVNVFGGAVALGHPIGASGARILTTLLNVLEVKKGRYGVATLCIGGGEGTAVIIEKI